MSKTKYLILIGILIVVIIIIIVIAVIVGRNSDNSENISTTIYTLSCLDGPSVRSIQFSGPFYIKTSEPGSGYYTLNFYNALDVKLLTQVYASGSSPRYIVPPVTATYFEYTFMCS